MNYRFPKLNIARFLNDEPPSNQVQLPVPHRENRIINDDENIECHIKSKNIESNDLYLHCNTCNNNCFYDDYYKKNNFCSFCKKSFSINNKFVIYKNI